MPDEAAELLEDELEQAARYLRLAHGMIRSSQALCLATAQDAQLYATIDRASAAAETARAAVDDAIKRCTSAEGEGPAPRGG